MNLAATLLGGFLVLLFLPPGPRPLDERADPLLAERQSCSVLFVGPSYVDDQIEPAVFNREAERIGSDQRACKFGIAALRGFEMRLWIERLLSEDWPRLELVVIDITLGNEVGFNEGNWFKPRVIEWHTWQSIPWLLSHYERNPLPKKERFSTPWKHAGHVAARYLAVGKGVEALGRIRLLERLRSKPKRGELRENPLAEPRVRRSRPRGAVYRGEVEHLKERKAKVSPTDNAWPLELREVVRAHKKEAYFLIAPVLYTVRVPEPTRRYKERLVVLDFNDPERYPELYDREVRGSTSHLDAAGSVLYSELLARNLKALERRRRR
jgi:hypothetical protein